MTKIWLMGYAVRTVAFWSTCFAGVIVNFIYVQLRMIEEHPKISIIIWISNLANLTVFKCIIFSIIMFMFIMICCYVVCNLCISIFLILLAIFESLENYFYRRLKSEASSLPGIKTDANLMFSSFVILDQHNQHHALGWSLF